jgi:hypothetical protein
MSNWLGWSRSTSGLKKEQRGTAGNGRNAYFNGEKEFLRNHWI